MSDLENTLYIYVLFEKPLKVCLNELPILRNDFKKEQEHGRKMWMLGILYIYDRVEKDVGRGYGWRFNENIKNFETLRSLL